MKTAGLLSALLCCVLAATGVIAEKNGEIHLVSEA